MTDIVRTGFVLVMGCLACLEAGCGSGKVNLSPEDGAEKVRENSMAELGEMLRLHKANTGKPPARTADLAKLAIAYPGGVRRVKNGDVVLLLGAPIAEGASDKILAYEKQAPETGGYVLMQDATTIKKVNPDVFRSSPKAPGKAEERPK
jgi:hypothetical protein